MTFLSFPFIYLFQLFISYFSLSRARRKRGQKRQQQKLNSSESHNAANIFVKERKKSKFDFLFRVYGEMCQVFNFALFQGLEDHKKHGNDAAAAASQDLEKKTSSKKVECLQRIRYFFIVLEERERERLTNSTKPEDIRGTLEVTYCKSDINMT